MKGMIGLTREKSCGALVMRRGSDGKLYILMIRQSRCGYRSFPKGHVEPGESERMTAEREVFEETAVRISVRSDFRRTVTYSPSPGILKDVVYFIAFTETEKTHPREGEIAEVSWIPLDAAEKSLAHENDRVVFRAAMKHPEVMAFVGGKK